LQIEENRQKPHAMLAFSTSRLTGIIFYICVVNAPQRENYFFYLAMQS